MDGGSTHKFVKPNVAAQLVVPLTDIEPFEVYVGNGECLVCQAKCSRLPVVLQGHEILVDFFVLDMSAVDMVLGVQ